MTEERWEQIVGNIKDHFRVLEETTEVILDERGRRESIIFEGSMGRIKLVREVTPLVIGRKVLASKRIGSQSREEFEYSDTEMIDRLFADRWNTEREEWVAIEPGHVF